ncbi:MAG: hypothetical protein RMJ97_00225 [Raineya sp.]|nr:hypothetical protein [Raineya sp.]MDW8295286.1 hypothetical protein [Raineya sp.]
MQFFRNLLHWLKEVLIGEDQSNFRAMILSLFFAFLFWFFYQLNTEQTYSLTYPVRLQYANGTNVDTFQRSILVTLSGTGWKIAREIFANQKERLLYYQIPATQVHNYVLSGSLRNVLASRLDKDMKIVEIKNDTFFINNNRNVRKIVRLYVRRESLNKMLREGYRIVSPIYINPQVVTFEGSVEKINQLPDSLPLTIRENSIRKNFDKLVSLSAWENSNLKAFPSNVRVSFNVERFFTRRLRFDIEKVNFPENVDLVQKRAEVLCVFKASMEKEIDLKDFNVIADFNKFHPEDSTITLHLEHIPQGIESAEIINPHYKIKAITKKND